MRALKLKPCVPVGVNDDVKKRVQEVANQATAEYRLRTGDPGAQITPSVLVRLAVEQLLAAPDAVESLVRYLPTDPYFKRTHPGSNREPSDSKSSGQTARKSRKRSAQRDKHAPAFRRSSVTALRA